MERESFEDDGVAAILNDGFISVKVDREERPDVDHIYMEVCQALTGSGGWPLTVLLTPEKKPFFAGTYFPKESKWGRPGLTDILRNVISQWRQDSSRLASYGDEIAQSLLRRLAPNPATGLGSAQLDQAYAGLEKYFDGEFGGFSSAPKFPTPHNLLFLLYYWRRTGKEKALAMVEKTLAGMRQGGIYDHLGFGFCRYSTDLMWFAPHFEKMLYDNALLCYAYLEACQATGNVEYARVAEEIIEYVLRDMTSPEGAFYSAEDADSEGIEGLFYLWTKDEIVDALGWEQGCIFADYYHVSAEGNFEHGKSILHAIGRNLDEYAGKLRMDSQEFAALLAEGRKKLYGLREQRVRPFRDDKVLASWNALMIAALAKASKVLENPDYFRAAESALTFVETRLTRDDGRILARFREGEAAYISYLDDYAFLLWALIELYEATFNIGFLKKAMLIAEDMLALFADQTSGGFYFTGNDAEELLVRPKELYDGAIPSGNSVAAFALVKLSRLTGDSSLLAAVEAAMGAFAAEVRQMPMGYVFFLLALDLYLDPPKQIVIAGSREDRRTESMLASVQQFYMPEVTLLFRDIDKPCEDAESFASISGKEAVSGQTAAYICDDTKCHPPITELEQFQKLLHDFSGRNN
ncbi:MAG: Cellobiose 2-epimerase [Anaerosporomusa subterranea]|jgi:uncharacterized protein YyaL (SSP411 family)|nr:Cellobiose 2-epimerase [Anaerosporomusa subterranea]